ncbi:uncharacterized protein I206_107252 [Kwoniella pini CBS 10737]|uniref:UBX domain-containing protein 1 n=1 Tax=Kwoniella pini CBS 10737 TaxID=1296096 RepID=A0AAJ8LCH0_9TREE
MPGLPPTQEDIDQFVAITQASPEDAAHFLESGTTLEGAIEDFFATQTASEPLIPDRQDDEDADLALDSPTMSDEPSNSNTAAPTGGPRTLGGEAAAEPLPAGWGRPERSRFGRLGESNDDEDDAPTGGDEPEELYAGGGRSGLAVQNPDDPRGTGNSLVDNILRMANQNGPRAPSAGGVQGAPQPASAFRGTGHTLGSDEAPSTAIAATDSSPAPTGSGAPSIPSVAGVTPSMMDNLLAGMFGRGAGGPAGAAGYPQQEQDDEEDDDDDSDENVATRRLTFWRNGFSIEDGPLLSYDDPQNKALLQAIESGRAPPSVFGVRFNQRLNVEVAQRRREDYQLPPKKPAKPFGGSGNRLGSPAPEVTSSTASMPGTPTSSGNAAAGGQATFELDASKPTTSIQLRLGDGTKMVAKVNLTHTVGDLRNYVSASRLDARSFILQTTFPSRELSDFNETIEAAKLQNAVVVQRFT